MVPYLGVEEHVCHPSQPASQPAISRDGIYQSVACAEVKKLLLRDMVSLPVAFNRLGAFSSVRSWNQPPSYEFDPGKPQVRFDMGQASENNDQRAHIPSRSDCSCSGDLARWYSQIFFAWKCRCCSWHPAAVRRRTESQPQCYP